MTDFAPPLARDEIAPRTLRVLHRGRARNPDVLLVEAAGGPVVVKDFAPRAPWVRRWLGPRITQREVRAYRALEGHPAVPRFLGNIDALAFALEYRPGRRMSQRIYGALEPGFIARLSDAVAAMHARGVVHLDLRHRSNVLVDDRGDPILIDFASAQLLARGGLALRALARFDWAAVEKWRQRVEDATGGATAAASASSGERRGASRPM